MRTPPPPGSKLVSDWIGLTVTAKRQIGNGHGNWPAGTKFTVKDASGGLRIEAPRCKKCGHGAYITRVHPRDVVIT